MQSVKHQKQCKGLQIGYLVYLVFRTLRVGLRKCEKGANGNV